jgi:hypothetical protein
VGRRLVGVVGLNLPAFQGLTTDNALAAIVLADLVNDWRPDFRILDACEKKPTDMDERCRAWLGFWLDETKTAIRIETNNSADGQLLSPLWN